MAITTSSELQKQLTVIFGFQDQFMHKVGDIVGIGALSRQRTTNLINRVINYLYAYNSMLIEYTGCHLYSIEFDLESYDKKKDIKLLPKSMVFVPGQFKEIHNFLLLLAPEMSLLAPEKSKSSVNKLGQTLYQISEVLDRDELKEEQKIKILNNFAKRFAFHLQGEVIEGKWKKKLIGIKNEDHEDPFLTINFERIFNWQTKELIVKKYQSRELEIPNTGLGFQKKFETFKLHPKIILEIIRNSFTLTANLLQIANTGSTSDTQHQLLVILLNLAKDYISQFSDRITIDQFKKHIEEYLSIVERFFVDFEKFCDTFIHSKKIAPLDKMLEDFVDSIPKENKNSFKQKFNDNMGILFKEHIKTHEYSYDSQQKVRSLEFETPYIYISQNAKIIIKSLKNSLPNYYQHFMMETLLVLLIEEIQKSLNSRKDSIIRILGNKSINQLAQYYQIKIENFCNLKQCLDPNEILKNFKSLVNFEISEFLNDIIFQIEDILEYCREKVPSNRMFNNTIDKLMLYRSRIETLWKLTLHQSTRKRIIEKVYEMNLVTPEDVSNFVVELLQKKFGGIQSSWKQNFFLYFTEYVKQYQAEYIEALENKEPWDSSKSLDLLFSFLEFRVQKAISIEGFLEPLKDYLNKMAMNAVDKHPLLKIYDYYLEGIEIVEQFPEFFHQNINRCLETLEFQLDPYPVKFFLKSLPPLDFITNKKLTETSNMTFTVSSFYDYILNSELKYFSKLIAKPNQIILESQDNDLFSGKPLKYRIKFDELGSKYIKTAVSTNFKYVLPKF